MNTINFGPVYQFIVSVQCKNKIIQIIHLKKANKQIISYLFLINNL